MVLLFFPIYFLFCLSEIKTGDNRFCAIPNMTIKKKCITCGTLNDVDCIEGCVVCETEKEWLYTCDTHPDVVFLTKRKKCPICDLKRQLEKIKKAAMLKTAVKIVSKSKLTKNTKLTPLTEHQLNYLVRLGMEKRSATNLSKLEADAQIRKLLG